MRGRKIRLIFTIALFVFIGVFYRPVTAERVFILCQPDSWVNVRISPGKRGEIIGRFDLGDELETDGKMKRGYLHLINLSLEDTEGWIHAGFVTDSPVTIYQIKTEIVSKGRVACRRAIKGTRRKWLRNGTKITVYAFSDSWAVTNMGFIKTDFIGGFE